MKTFTEFLGEQQQIDEGIIRSGSIATFAARSAAAGKKADQAYRDGLSALENTTTSGDFDKRLDRLEVAFKSLLQGLMHQRQQTGNHVTLDVLGHTIGRRKRTKS